MKIEDMDIRITAFPLSPEEMETQQIPQKKRTNELFRPALGEMFLGKKSEPVCKAWKLYINGEDQIDLAKKNKGFSFKINTAKIQEELNPKEGEKNYFNIVDAGNRDDDDLCCGHGEFIIDTNDFDHTDIKYYLKVTLYGLSGSNPKTHTFHLEDEKLSKNRGAKYYSTKKTYTPAVPPTAISPEKVADIFAKRNSGEIHIEDDAETFGM